MTVLSSAAELAPSNRSLSLERKLPLLIFGILAVVLATSLGLSYYEVRRAAERAAADRLSALSVQLAGMLQQQISARVNSLRRLAADSGVVAALRSPAAVPTMSSVIAINAFTTPADSATPPLLLLPDGRRLSGMKLESADEIQRGHADLRVFGATPDSAHVSKLSSDAGRLAIWITAPVHENGTLVGYVAQERRIGNNQRAIQPFRDLIGPDVEFYFRNSKDSLAVDLLGKPVPPPRSVRTFTPGVDMYAHGDGDALASSTPIRGTPLVLILESPMRAVLTGPVATLRVLMIIAVLLAVAGAGFAWWFGHQLTRPLVGLTSAVEAIAQGDYSERVALPDGDEIGRLATAFNRMAERVQESSLASSHALETVTKTSARQQFLAEASQILAASLSDQTLLAGLARHCVPTLADYCTIHVAEEDGSIRRMETAHYDPKMESVVRSLVNRYEYRIDADGDVPSVMRSRKPTMISRIELDAVLKTAKDADVAELVRQVRPSSFMCVPLVARGRAFGAMSFTMTDSGRAFRSDDLELATELSRRTAVAIDNAVIYRSSLALRLEAEAASNAKSDFLAKMSHEIRTPINAMMGYAELLEMGIGGPVTEAQARQLGRIRASGEHLTSLVDEILDLAKIEAGRMHVEPTVSIAADSAEAAVALVRPSAVTKGVELFAEADGDVHAEYFGDTQRVQQILTNLLSNAVKFTRPGGRVSVRCDRGVRPGSNGVEYSWTSISVRDSGVGISNENLDRIFQPFVQVENGYTRAHGGTGLGLTISRSLAQMMGGDIQVNSIVGEGSRFTLWLPGPNPPVSAD
ncbi:MAG: ATP-binding protein [Gemmatimonadaceae bacterium]